MSKQKQHGTEYPQLMLDGQICFPLYACARKVISAYTPLLKPLGLTYTQYLVMLELWEKEKEKVGRPRGNFEKAGSKTEKEGEAS